MPWPYIEEILCSERIRCFRLDFLIANAYLVVKGSKALLVDTSPTGSEKIFPRLLRICGIEPRAVTFAILTHAHFDHAGGLKWAQNICGSRLCAHNAETALLRSGKMTIPPGTSRLGKLASGIGQFLNPIFRYPAVEPDIVISEPMSLEPFGFPGLVIPTPGHTAGSVSVLFENGLCFIGDNAANLYGFVSHSVLPPFAEDEKALLLSWKTLIEAGAKQICPGHGRPFPVQRLVEEVCFVWRHRGW